jgi:hypothetical protein
MSALLKIRAAEALVKDAFFRGTGDGTLQTNAPQYLPTDEVELPLETVQPTYKKIVPGSKGIPGAMSSQRFAGDKLIAVMPSFVDEDKSMFGNVDSYKSEPNSPNTEDVKYPGDQRPIRDMLPSGVHPSNIDHLRDKFMRSPAGGIT